MVNSKILGCAALAACFFVGLGCKGIAGITDRTLAEDTDGGVGDGGLDGDAEVEADAPIDTSCEMPPPAAASLRLGNLIPSLDRVDFCIKSSNDASFEGIVPTIRSWGGGCQVGLGYRDVTALFGSEPGVFDIAAVRVDATTDKDTVCSGTPIATASQVAVQEGEFLSVLLFGSGPSDAVLRTGAETRASSNDSPIRFMNGLVGAGAVDCGMTLAADLPQQIGTPGFTNVPFASVTNQTGSTPLGSIDGNGYLSLSLGVATISLGAAPAGSLDVIAVEANKYARGISYSVYALGRMNDIRFPPEMYICDEQKADGILARCGGLAIDLRVDTFNAQLAGPFGPWDAERAPKMVETINGLDTDAICVHEVWSKAHRDQIIAGTASFFPHSAMFDDDLETELDDPTDANGVTPPAYEEPPCSGDPTYAGTEGDPNDPPSDAYLISQAIDCIRDNCFQPTGDETGGRPVPGISDCMATKCLGEVLKLVGGGAAQKGCYSCLFASIASYETPDYMREQCTTNPEARFVYRGSSATQVLSRYEIVDPEQWVIPSTEWRVNIIRAPLKLPNDAKVDLYCTQLTTPADAITRPYTGLYGDGGEGLLGWQNELYLQAEKLTAYVQQKSQAAGRMAIIAGTFYSGPAYFDGDTQVLESINETAYNTLAANFPFALPADYVPACTYCNDNPLLAPPGSTPTGGNTRQSHIFVSGIPITAISSAESVVYPFIVDLETEDGTPFQAPASTHYGFRSTVRIVR